MRERAGDGNSRDLWDKKVFYVFVPSIPNVHMYGGTYWTRVVGRGTDCAPVPSADIAAVNDVARKLRRNRVTIPG